MQIQINSDKSVVVDSDLLEILQTNVSTTLERFDAQITRIEVHLSDVNGLRSSDQDKRCLMEARPAGRDPVVVTNQADNLEDAVRGAAQKLKRMLESLFGRLGER